MGLIGGIVKTAAVAGTASVVRGRVSRRQAEKFADRDQAIAENRAEGFSQGMNQSGTQQSAATPAPVAPDPTEQIKNLAELRDQGILTEEEFTAKKKQLLGI
jgi:putative oligomerization/nucleic acid binding protein